MKPMGIIRNVDALGRIVIPKEIRDTHKWDTHTPIEMFATDKGVFFQAYCSDKEKAFILEELSAVKISSTNEAAKKMIQNAMDFINKQ
jgi:AbrB family transcriptional regulator, stage V sporulation protein T